MAAPEESETTSTRTAPDVASEWIAAPMPTDKSPWSNPQRKKCTEQSTLKTSQNHTATTNWQSSSVPLAVSVDGPDSLMRIIRIELLDSQSMKMLKAWKMPPKF